MRDRIKQFMDFKGISASDLAGLLEVQRSNVSHILNGRNLPGAGFIEKFLAVFPELNARWLFLGTGTMLGDPVKAGNASPEVIPLQQKVQFPEEKTTNPLSGNKVDNNPPANQLHVTESVQPAVKKVEKIVVFYTDKTFSDYRPE